MDLIFQLESLNPTPDATNVNTIGELASCRPSSCVFVPRESRDQQLFYRLPLPARCTPEVCCIHPDGTSLFISASFSFPADANSSLGG